MKILQLCNKIPYPPIDGGTMAMHSLTENLLSVGFKVKVVAIETYKNKFDFNRTDLNYRTRTNFESIFIDIKINIIAFLKSFFNKEPYQIHRFFSHEFENRLKQILSSEDFDLIQLESLFMTPYISTIRKYTSAKIVLRSHNVEFLIWNRKAKSEVNILMKIIYSILSNQTKQYEVSMLNKYDAIATITDFDKMEMQKLGCKIPIEYIPFGIVDPFLLNRSDFNSKNDECFIFGTMNWHPNIQGLDWFLKEVWTKTNRDFPKLKLIIAGRFIPDKYFKLENSSIRIMPDVTNQYEFMVSSGIMLVPIFTGSGVRIKIIEGMFCSKTIITTSLGAEGINVENMKNILIANTPKEFFDCIVFCVKNPKLSSEIGKNARAFAISNYENSIIKSKIFKFYNTIS